MSNKDEEHESEYEDYAEYQNRLDSGEEVFEEVVGYVDGYFNIDENIGELTHGPISIGRIIIIDDEIHTELDVTDSEESRIAGSFESVQDALDDLWNHRDEANQGSNIFE